MMMMIKMTPTMSMKLIEYCLCWWCCTHDGFLWLDGKKRTPSSCIFVIIIFTKCAQQMTQSKSTKNYCRGFCWQVFIVLALALWMSRSKLVEKSCTLFLLSLYWFENYRWLLPAPQRCSAGTCLPNYWQLEASQTLKFYSESKLECAGLAFFFHIIDNW